MFFFFSVVHKYCCAEYKSVTVVLKITHTAASIGRIAGALGERETSSGPADTSSHVHPDPCLPFALPPGI